ncbi:TniQ family protein [Paenibacillus paridis]|uniref:TniQ family protein n=1 Tax=Paenibacillus paridis TaxID=2583376 RepID=UPI00139118A5|nr:TniQ family protein [Paenibacillus paridis]
MVNHQLTVRPTPKSGESLTSFLFRAGNLNGCDEMDIWRDIHAGSDHMIRSNLFCRLDYDFCLINPRRLTRLLDISLDDIAQLTYFTVCSKFFDNPYHDYDRAMVMIQMALDKKSKRFCPSCTKQENVYMLIWQLKDIDKCYIHNIKLDSNVKLVDIPEVEADIKDFNQQVELYRRWQFLLTPGQMLTKKYGNLNMERSLALKTLFVAQNQATVYIRKDIVGFSKNLVKSLVAFVRGTSVIKKVTQSILFEVLDYANMTIEDFVKLDVPKLYLNSLLTVKKKKTAGICETPWCCHRERKKMIYINERVEPRKKGIRYPYYFVCEGCFMRYAYQPESNQWQEINGKIELVSLIKNLAEVGMTRAEVSRKLKINLFRISEIFGYLAYHRLLPDSISSLYAYSIVPENLVTLFNGIPYNWNTYPESKYKKMRERYGWNLKMFSYYYAHSEVQLYFIHKSSDLKKPLKKYLDLSIRAEQTINDLIFSETRLSFSQVAVALECSERTIHSHSITTTIQKAKEKQLSIRQHSEEKELRRIFDNLVTDYDDKELLLMRTIYERLGRNRDYIILKYPGFISYMNASIKEVNKKVKDYQLKLLVNQIREAILQHTKSQMNLSVASVARQLGIKYIHVKGYKSVKDIIKQEIERYSFGHLNS